jgi:hypothetical protein
MNSMEQTFAEKFFRTAPEGPGNSMSGTGSSLSVTTYLRQDLPILLNEYNVRVFLDLPCGDFNWMKEVDLGEIQYIGGDIISDLVERNQRLYSSPLRTFQRLDLTTSALPRADAVMCRDCLVHLSDASVFAALRNICNSGANYLLTTHYTARAQVHNYDIPDGAWRRIIFDLPPFLLPPPQRLIVEGSTEENRADKTLALWPIAQIRSRLQ